MSQIQSEIVAGVGLITLNRPEALNALSLQMVIDLTVVFTDFRDDPSVEVVAIRGNNKRGVFGAFCAGGDIHFFHDAAIANDPALEDFFTAEYSLNNLLYSYPKPYAAFMDGVIMGGGMGLAQGADLRMERNIVRHCFHTEHLGRSGTSSKTVEGIRALAVDKDNSPGWNPARIEDITSDMIEPFFTSPWPADQHPQNGSIPFGVNYNTIRDSQTLDTVINTREAFETGYLTLCLARIKNEITKAEENAE